jgi:hypothetical protein
LLRPLRHWRLVASRTLNRNAIYFIYCDDGGKERKEMMRRGIMMMPRLRMRRG